MGISPFVCRMRLGKAMLDVRVQGGYTTEQMARELDIHRQRISHIENGKVRPDPDEIRRILEYFRVPPTICEQIMALARGAAHHGWWERYDDEMGPRQARTADLEAGATTIFQFQPVLFPGLLQTPEFTAVRAAEDRPAGSRRYSAARALEARARRQEILEGPGATPYEVVLDEAVLRRPTAGPEVMRAQLDHLVDVALHRRTVTVRVLPFVTRIGSYRLPRTAFSRYTYSDPGDPVVVTVDTNIDDLIITDPDKVAVYADLYAKLQEAALSAADSVELLTTTAEEYLSRR